MSKKLAIIFPGIGYTCDRPLLYYSRKTLKNKGYEVICVKYTGLEEESIFDTPQEDLVVNGAPANRVSKNKILSFVAKAKECAASQLEDIDFTQYERLVFVSKSIGAVVGSIYAKQLEINPYHIMITPLDIAFQFVESGSGSVFYGTNDSLVNCDGIVDICRDKMWAYHAFKDGNHSLETGDVEVDVEHLKRYLSTVGNILADLEKSVYDFELIGRNQTVKSMKDYEGKVLLIVNTATGCGFTPQYQALEDIYEKYQKQGFEILDFPCNQFANQAPGTEDEIYSFCTSRYEISFEQFAKINVNGEKESDLYKYLKSRKGFKGFDMSKQDSKFLVRKLKAECPGYEYTSDIKWNFTKFLVNQRGQVIERFEPTTDMSLVEEAIAQLL